MSDIRIKWKKMGPEFTYNVMYSKNTTGPWTTHNTTLLTDSSIDFISEEVEGPYELENTYTISGLDPKTKYYIKVSCNDRYYKWWYSYSSYDSLEGGEYDLSTSPNPDLKNTLSFQLGVNI